jgi:branched-subunit amino acid transport protein AzlD
VLFQAAAKDSMVLVAAAVEVLQLRKLPFLVHQAEEQALILQVVHLLRQHLEQPILAVAAAALHKQEMQAVLLPQERLVLVVADMQKLFIGQFTKGQSWLNYITHLLKTTVLKTLLCLQKKMMNLPIKLPKNIILMKQFG